MKLRQRQNFLNLRSEGSLLPVDLLQRIQERDAGLKGLAPDDYYLVPHLRLNEAISQSWTRLLGAWQSFQESLRKLPVSDLGTTTTRERWLLPLFQELNFGRLTTARAIEVDGRTYPISHFWQSTPIHLVSCKIGLDERTAGIAGAARISPHGLLQELLNRSERHLWGIVSNGRQLRLLRDNRSLTRQAYLEFDLEAIFEGDSYSDFTLLWLLCHQSRVELRELERPESCWLEEWSKEAHLQGTRALDQLRNGVQRAIEALGRGFLAHPANQRLHRQLREGQLDRQEYYRQLLRLVYRLLFLFVAEDRDLLFAPEADETARQRYLDFYSVSRLRRLAERRTGTRHHDQYHSLRVVMRCLAEQGAPALALPALGGYLFSAQAIPAIDDCEIANLELLEAIRALSFLHDGQVRRTVDYRNLRSEELGSVYEALLELHPEIHLEARQFSLTTASGNERKTTGSYYTPDSLVNCLLDSALEPVVLATIERAAPGGPAAIEAALLALKVVDPACGSGHFLIAAASRLARHLASVRTGDGEPAPTELRRALRDVIGHCIYGVDLNPMAVELCKVSLWMESLQPGRPLSFLDHRLQCGNSLIGVTPALLRDGIPDEAFQPITGDDKAVCNKYRKINRDEHADAIKLIDRRLIDTGIKLGSLATTVLELESVSDDTIEGVREKQRRWEELVRSNDYKFSGLLADAWCAAFVWKKIEAPGHPDPITEATFRRIEQSPWSIIPSPHQQEIERLAQQYQFFHWHLAFPDVFRPAVQGEPAENPAAGWQGGFDVVLGNPPWEHTELKEKEWFAQLQPEIASAQTASIRKNLIENLAKSNPQLYEAFTNARRTGDGSAHFISNSKRYPLCGRGRINTYAIFAELFQHLISSIGFSGFIAPSGIATDDTTKYFFQQLIRSNSLVSLYDFENRTGLFLDVHRSFKFALITTRGASTQESIPQFAFYALNTPDLQNPDKCFNLSAQEISLLNPNTKTCPIFRNKRDYTLTKGIYQRIPIFINEQDPSGNPWGVTFKQGLFNMASDSHLFLTKEKLTKIGAQPWQNCFLQDNVYYLPLYEAKMIHQYDHRWAGYAGLETVDVSTRQKQDPSFQVLPRYWVPEAAVEERLSRDEGPAPQWLLGWRDICRSTDERTVIASVIPRVACGDTLLLMFPSLVFRPLAAALTANLSALVLDYAARQKIGGTHLKYHVFKQLPIFSPYKYEDRCSWSKDELLKSWITPRVMELIYTSHDLKGFATDCGYTGDPFPWDEERRFRIRCELDAAFFHLYGIAREDVDYILDTFPIVRRKEEAAHGEYRTKRVILELYDEMGSGHPFQTRLDPPPARGWTPPEVVLAPPPTEAPFALEMVDSRPQLGLFDPE